MCVIFYQPKKSKSLDRTDLYKMWETNSDGGGIMWIEEDGVHYSKGYMNFDSMYYDYLLLKNKYNYELALHFRIATSGGVNPQMTHPFPVSNRVTDMGKLEGHTDICVMHNGIIPIDHTRGLSDTVEYTIRKLYPRARQKDRLFGGDFDDRIKSEISYSKLLLFSADAVHMIGDWEQYKGGYVSNKRFLNNGYHKSFNTNNYGYTYNKYDAFDDYYEFLKSLEK